MKNQFLLYAALALLMFVGCNEDSQDNTDNKVAVTSVTLSPPTLSLIVGDTGSITAVVAPDSAANKAVAWSSNNTDVATVSDAGLVTAIAAGTASITVTTADGGKTATCAVSVIDGVVVTNNGMTDTIKLVNVEGGYIYYGLRRIARRWQRARG